MIERTKSIPALILFLVFCRALLAQQPDPKRIAVVNGQPISAEEVQAAAAEDLAKIEFRKAQVEIEMKRDRDSAMQNALDGILKNRVLAAEAAKRNISVDDLLEIEVNSTAAPGDDDVVDFYNVNKSGLTGSLGDNVASIREYLRDQRRQEIFVSFLDRLKKTYGAISFVEPLRVSIPTEGRPSKGSADAPVTLVEFSDFECPFCRALAPTLQQISAHYKDKIRIVYFQFPLADMHKNALKAAEASLCAFEQGRFWQMHDAMFIDQSNLGIDAVKLKASALSMDMASFEACLDSGKTYPDVRKDVGEGVKVGVAGTPALFINGRVLVGNQPYAEIQRIIEDELRRAESR
jgi:predicted DsbA family dithiol-disulfide isomerase